MLTPAAGKGIVTGGIIPCAGIPNPSGPRYAGGSVTVLKGRVTWRAIDAQSSSAIFPSTVVSFQNVGVDQTYVFSLDPGDYVLRATFPAPANVQPWTTVTVRAGVTTHIDIPNECM